MREPAIIAALIAGGLTIVAALIGALVSTERLMLANLFRWRRKVPEGFVILINGASGVGKTTIAWALARKYNVVSVLGAELIREALRYEIEHNQLSSADVLLESSFLAYEKLPEGSSPADPDKVINAFEQQCNLLAGPVIRIINRIRKKRDPLIIEGVNIMASSIFASIPCDPLNKIVFVNLYLDSEDVHRGRLWERGGRSRELPESTYRYVNNLASIRKIDLFLKQDSIKAKNQYGDNSLSIVSVENSKSIHKSVNQVDRCLRQKLKLLRHHRIV